MKNQKRKISHKVIIISIAFVFVIIGLISSIKSCGANIGGMTLEEVNVQLSELADQKASYELTLQHVHTVADSLRSIGYSDDSEIISKLSSEWHVINSQLNDEIIPKVEELTVQRDELIEKQRKAEAERKAKEAAKAEAAKREAEKKQKYNVVSAAEMSSSSKGRYLGVYDATAYCLDGITSTGVKPTVGVTVAVDPKVIKYGTKLRLVRRDTGEDLGVWIAQDCGGAIKGNRLDVYLSSESACRKWGHKSLDVYVVD